MPNIPLNMPWPRAGLSGVPFDLTAEEEDRKLQAVNVYHSQMQFMAPFLLAFVRTTELYSVSP